MAPALRTRRATVGGVAGLDLEVLGGVGVDDGEPLLEVVDEHDAGLPAGQRRRDPFDVPGGRDLLVELGLDVVGQRRETG